VKPTFLELALRPCSDKRITHKRQLHKRAPAVIFQQLEVYKKLCVLKKLQMTKQKTFLYSKNIHVFSRVFSDNITQIYNQVISK